MKICASHEMTITTVVQISATPTSPPANMTIPNLCMARSLAWLSSSYLI